MSNSILDCTRKMVGVSDTDNTFDLDLITHINTALAVLNQLGVGPDLGFAIEDDVATWPDFLGDDLAMNLVKTYVYLYVRLLFDPPASGYLKDALEKQKTELEVRINLVRECRLPPVVTVVEEF